MSEDSGTAQNEAHRSEKMKTVVMPGLREALLLSEDDLPKPGKDQLQLRFSKGPLK